MLERVPPNTESLNRWILLLCIGVVLCCMSFCALTYVNAKKIAMHTACSVPMDNTWLDVMKLMKFKIGDHSSDILKLQRSSLEQAKTIEKVAGEQKRRGKIIIEAEDLAMRAVSMAQAMDERLDALEERRAPYSGSKAGRPK